MRFFKYDVLQEFDFLIHHFLHLEVFHFKQKFFEHNLNLSFLRKKSRSNYKFIADLCGRVSTQSNLCLYLFMSCWQSIFFIFERFHYNCSGRQGVISGLHFPVFGLNTEIYLVNLHIQSEYRKIRTRNNSVFGHFSRSGK